LEYAEFELKVHDTGRLINCEIYRRDLIDLFYGWPMNAGEQGLWATVVFKDDEPSRNFMYFIDEKSIVSLNLRSAKEPAPRPTFHPRGALVGENLEPVSMPPQDDLEARELAGVCRGPAARRHGGY
jgi:hypothetical protein